MDDDSRVTVVCGAGGFIGGHLVKDLLARGHGPLRAVDLKPFEDWHQRFDAVENLQLDLRQPEGCRRALLHAGTVYNLASDMGGMGFIEQNRALCMLNVIVNTHLLQAAIPAGVSRYFFASSACVYNIHKQTSTSPTPLRESDAYPAQPEDGYGWEKLFSERLCRNFTEDFGLFTSVARLHNIYGSHSSYAGGREKAPAAICRKVAEAVRSGNHSIEIWGDGEQSRSFTHIEDCLHGIRLMMDRGIPGPLNLGSSQLVTINQLVDLVSEIAGVSLQRRYKLDAAQGVAGRNSDNTLAQAELGWQPSIDLRRGLESLYDWVMQELEAKDAVNSGARKRAAALSD